MAVLYKIDEKSEPFFTEGESMTEQEHMDSCDINIMIGRLSRGQEVRGSGNLVYGIDDTTMDPVRFRIEKEQAEKELAAIAAGHEFSEEELKMIPQQVQEKFKFKTKKKAKENAKNDSNDQTQTSTADSEVKT